MGFRLNRDKCEFMKTEIRFLGHTFDSIKADMTNDTRMAIQNFERPKNRKAVQGFSRVNKLGQKICEKFIATNQTLGRIVAKKREIRMDR